MPGRSACVARDAPGDAARDGWDVRAPLPAMGSLGALVDLPRARFVSGFRSIVSGDPTGMPAWMLELEHGDDAGYFGPDSTVWAVHGNMAGLMGGIRSLLVQALHPAAVTGVDEHSTYREDPRGRLAGTGRWLTMTTFGSRAAAERECARVRGVHRRVRGTYCDDAGAERPYRANDEHLLAWVHATFTQSMLVCHEVFAGPVPGGPDAYVREWATAGELVGVSRPPRTAAELEALLQSYEPELAHTPATGRTVAFLRDPPAPPPAQVAYQVIFAAAASTLADRHRRLLGLPPVGTRTAQAAGRAVLTGMRVLLGEGPPAAAAARRRLTPAEPVTVPRGA
jgi:uncharacterized protein (DUF2236 family)